MPDKGIERGYLAENSQACPDGWPLPVSGFVLAGGKSSRMGRNKAMLPWHISRTWTETLLDHTANRLRVVCDPVAICGFVPGSQPPGPDSPSLPPNADSALAQIPDARPGTGPLGGIVAALEQSRTDWNLFLAIDLPLLPAGFLRDLLNRVPAGRSEPLCIIPTLSGRPQPLCSVLHRSLACGLRNALESGQYKVMLALQLAAERIAPARPEAVALDLWEIEDLPAEAGLQPREWFLNVNTPADWDRAEELALRSLEEDA